jgi:predicted DNA-binding transcriptional regulator YafY
LPLHTSQQVIESNNEYTIFEYKLAPTYDFIMELRKYCSKLEVLAPQSLREEFAKEAEHLAQMYL